MRLDKITTERLPQALEARIRKTGGCWEWVGTINHAGYGVLEMDGRLRRAHRLMLEVAGVEIPDGMMVDHMCRNRACVNPSHLRVVDARTNSVENSLGVSAINAAKTHCKNGHEFTQENTYQYLRYGRAARDCLICKKAAKQRFDDRLRQLRERARKLCDPCTCGGKGLCRDIS